MCRTQLVSARRSSREPLCASLPTAAELTPQKSANAANQGSVLLGEPVVNHSAAYHWAQSWEGAEQDPGPGSPVPDASPSHFSVVPLRMEWQPRLLSLLFPARCRRPKSALESSCTNLYGKLTEMPQRWKILIISVKREWALAKWVWVSSLVFVFNGDSYIIETIHLPN